MATINNDSLAQQLPHAGQYGNRSVWGPEYTFQKAGVLNGDVLRICRLPAGARVDDFKLVHDACGAGVTCKVGYEPVNPADGPSANDAYWIPASTSIASAGTQRSNAHPVTFNFDVYVILTVGGANFSGSPKLTAVAAGVATGTR